MLANVGNEELSFVGYVQTLLRHNGCTQYPRFCNAPRIRSTKEFFQGSSNLHGGRKRRQMQIRRV